MFKTNMRNNSVYFDNLPMTHSEVLPTLVGMRIPNVHSMLLPFASLIAVPSATAVEFTKSATPRALKGPHWGGEAAWEL